MSGQERHTGSANLQHAYVAGAAVLAVAALIAAAFNGESNAGSKESAAPTGAKAAVYYKRLVTLGRGLIVTPVGEGALPRLPAAASVLGDGTRFALSLDRPTQVSFLEITILPGASIPWHHHSGPLVGVLFTGKVIDYRPNRPGCAPKLLRAGSAVFEPNTQVHTLTNPFKVPAVLYVVVWSPHDTPPTIASVHMPVGCPTNPK